MVARRSMGRRRAVNGEEADAYSKWRHVLCYLSRPGAVRQIKKRTHKRERQEARAAIRKEAS